MKIGCGAMRSWRKMRGRVDGILCETKTGQDLAVISLLPLRFLRPSPPRTEFSFSLIFFITFPPTDVF